MMKKKNIIAVAMIIGLSACNVVNADSNSLVKMDVKKSAADDTVNVTFYTTGGSQNSVVTRKSDNKYVVLLPNVSGTSTSVPSLGAVKDLITDVNVKNVDDGIGGYTKVTFSTSKPVKINTSMQKTSVVTPSNQEYKNIIAQNNTKPAATNNTTQQQIKAVAPAVASTSKPATTNTAKPVATNTTKPVTITPKASGTSNNSAANTKSATKPQAAKAPAKPATTQQKAVSKQTTPKVEAKPVKTQSVASVKPEATKPETKVEPKVETKVATTSTSNIKPIEQIAPNVETVNSSNEVQTPVASTTEIPKKKGLNKVLTGGILSVLVLFAIGKILSVIASIASKNTHRVVRNSYEGIGNNSSSSRDIYDKLIENVDLSWQDKYKAYEKSQLQKPQIADSSYVTNMGANKKAIITPAKSEDKQTRYTSSFDMRKINKLGKSTVIPDLKETSAKNKLEAQISQMEHSLAQTPSIEPVENNSGVKSEANAISETMSGVKLKSFAKPKTLETTKRELVKNETETLKPQKEGRHVRLKTSPLSVSVRKYEKSGLKISDLLRRENGEGGKMKTRTNYSSASIDEYMSILDSENKTVTPVTEVAGVENIPPAASIQEAFAQLSIPSKVGNSSNPIAKSFNPWRKESNSMSVKSSYKIDGSKGFYLVDNNDNTSAIIGKIGERTFVLKKFDKIVDKTLQVRQNGDNEYLVRAGNFKCLVDVTEEKMGTLLEI